MMSSRRSAQIFHGGILSLLLVLPLLRGGWDLWAQTLVILSACFFGLLFSLLQFKNKSTDLAHFPKVGRDLGPAALAVLLTGVVSMLLSDYPRGVFSSLIVQGVAVGFYFLTASLSPVRRTLYTRVWAVAGLLPVVVAFSAGDGSLRTLTGPLVNANVLSALTILVWPVFFLWARDETFSVRQRWMWGLSGGAVLVGGWFTGSLVGFVVTVGQAGFLFFRKDFRLSPRAWKITGVVGVGGIALVAFLYQNEWSKFFTGDADRWSWWLAAIRMMGADPLWGVGPGAFGEAYPLHRLDPWGLNSLYAHNVVLETFAERGLLGGLALVAFVAMAVGRALRGKMGRESLGLIVGLAGFFVHSLFHIGYAFPSIYWLFFAGLGLLRLNPAEGITPVRGRRWAWTIGGVSLVLGTGAWAVFRSDVNAAYARVAFQHTRWDAAKIFVDRGIFWNRWNPDLYVLRATLRYIDKDMEGASADMARCLRLAPTSATYYREAAELALRRGQDTEALDFYDRAVRLLPLNPLGWTRRAEIQRRVGRTADARVSLQNAQRALSDARVMAGAPEAKAALENRVRALLEEPHEKN